MNEHEFPEISAAALRDNATPARVERIWKRLEGDVTTARPSRRGALWVALPVGALSVFALGVFVGAQGRVEPPPQTLLAPEPAARAELEPGAAAERAPDAQSRQPPRAARTVVPRAEPAAQEELELEPEPVPDALEPQPPAPEPIHVTPPPAQTSLEWQRLFDEGEFDAARRALARQGGFAAGFDAALAAASPEQAVNLADLAVQSGQRSRAIEALRRVVGNYGDDPVAPLAAYKLGNLLEKQGDRAGAAEAFASYRRLSPKGDLAEDALARLVDVAIERGDLERAQQLADQYAKDFPNGRRLSDIRDRLQKLSGTAAEAGDAGAPSGTDELPAEEPQDDDRDRAE